MLKKKLEARMKKLEAKKAELLKRSEESNDAKELRAINDQLMDIANELRDTADMIADLAKGEDSGDGEGDKGEGEGQRSFNPLATYGIGQVRSEEPDMEYRKAFMNLVTTGTPIPPEIAKRADANTLTSEVASVIPTYIMSRIIERLTIGGMILPEITRTSYAGGMVVPTSSVKPVASWVAEGAGSDRQKKTTGKVTFSYYKLRCEVSISMEVGTMGISVFEAAFIANVADAMIVAIEKAILAGTGSGQPTGIISTGVGDYSDHVITIADSTTGIPTYEELVTAEAAVPAEYENTAKWFMTKAQFMKFVAMTDSNGQPIGRVDWGTDKKPSRTLLGREVIIHPYATEMGDYVAGIFDFKDYVLNTIYDLGIERKRSWETEDLLTKAVMSVDGKPVDNYSLILLQIAS